MAIRKRNFDGPAIATAIESGRLRIFWDGDPSREPGAVAATIEAMQEQGHSVAVFSHHNDALAALSDQLRVLGVDHEIAGLSESLTAALEAQLAIAKYAGGVDSWEAVLRSLAVFVTSSVRGDKVPNLAYQILGQPGGSETLAHRLTELQHRVEGTDIQHALTEAAGAHTAIGLPNKSSAWARAAQLLTPMLHSANRFHNNTDTSEQAVVARLERMIVSRRAAMLTEDTNESEATVQLMNLHQTKGREADATVVVLRADDFFGFERTEPFEEGSRLLYVIFSRARERIVVLIFGTQLKALVGPLAGLAEPMNSEP